jgi:hypothetical protein
MANTNAPFGLRPIKRRDGQTYHGGVNSYPLASATAANFGVGTLMKRTGSGNYVTANANGATASIGVCLGVVYRDSRGNQLYLPNWVSGTTTFNSEDGQVLICDDPQTLFLLQFNATGFAAADVGQFAGVTFGSIDANGNDTSVGDGADITGTADNVKIEKLSLRPLAGRAANAYGAYAIAEVSIGVHERAANMPAS